MEILIKYEISVWQDYMKTIYREASISGSSPNFIVTDIEGNDISNNLSNLSAYIGGIRYYCTILSILSTSSISIKYYNGSTNVNTTVPKVYTEHKFFDEKKIATIGSDTLKTAISAFDGKLSLNVDGTAKLSFSFQHLFK